MFGRDPNPLAITSYRNLRAEAEAAPGANLEAIAIIRSMMNERSQSWQGVGNLEVKPSINGLSQEQLSLPLVHSKPIHIDPSQFTIPAQCGGGSLRQLIATLCSKYHLTSAEGYSYRMKNINFTSIAIAIAGQPSTAEFVPAFSSSKTTYVLAFSFAQSGDGGLKVDFLKVKGSLTCTGRSTPGSSTAFKAEEIPQSVVQQALEQHPDYADSIKRDGCVVGFIEIGLEENRLPILKKPTQPCIMKPSHYSHVSQGGETDDNTVSITVSARPYILSINIYNIAPVIVNTYGLLFSSLDAARVIERMQSRALEVRSIYEDIKYFNLPIMLGDLNHHLKDRQVATIRSPILDHALLRLASIEELPYRSQIIASEDTEDIFQFWLWSTEAVAREFCDALQRLFNGTKENPFCEYSSPDMTEKNLNRIMFHTKAVRAQLPKIIAEIDRLLTNPLLLSAYQRMSRDDDAKYKNVSAALAKMAKKSFGIQAHTNVIEAVLLHMFHCKEVATTMHHDSGLNFIERLFEDMHFAFNISEDAARQFVEDFNKQFSGCKFIRSDARISGKDTGDLCQISIPCDVLLQSEFLEAFQKGLDDLQLMHPLIIERLQFESRVRKHKTEDLADQLLTIATSIDYQAETPAVQSFTKAIVAFSAILCDPNASCVQRVTAKRDLKQVTQLLESTQSDDEKHRFKEGDKRKIKEVEQTLGLRMKK